MIPLPDHLANLKVNTSVYRAEGPGFESRLRRDFSGSSHTSDVEIGTPVTTLPDAWQLRVSTGTGRLGVSILCLGEVEGLICNFYLSVAARETEQIRPVPGTHWQVAGTSRWQLTNSTNSISLKQHLPETASPSNNISLKQHLPQTTSP